MNRPLPVSPATRFGQFYSWFLFVLVLVGAWAWNHEFGPWTRRENLWQINDVPDILKGFTATPNLWKDGLRWWYGPWIQQGVEAYRPLSSVLLWLECFVGQKYGFDWVSRFGVCLVALLSWQCVCVAREVTRSRGAMLVAALLAPSARLWLMHGVVPESWLTWFAVHHDLAMISVLLGSLLWWIRWLCSGRKRDLGWALALFIAGVLFKEFFYIFPAMALWLAVLHPWRRVEMRKALVWVGAMFAFLAMAWVFRSHVLAHPYNPPPLKIIHFIRRPFLYWFPAFYKYVLSEDWFGPVLALWLFVSVGAGLRWQHKLSSSVLRVGWVLGVLLGAMAIAELFDGVAEGFWYFAEVPWGPDHCADLVEMIFTLWALRAIWKYRRETPLLAVMGVMFLAYVPVWTLLGWHYTLAGWFVRAGLWWPLLFQLARLDWLKWPAAERWVRRHFERRETEASVARASS